MKESKVTISVFGLGYVGCVVSACFAREGFKVIGVDVDLFKVECINGGRSPIIEPELEGLIKQAVEAGRLKATGDAEYAVENSQISMVCVGTPSKTNGDIDYTYVERVIRQIGEALNKKNAEHFIVIRSTIFPGTIEKVVEPILKQVCTSEVFSKIEVCHNPEFLREGCAIADFFGPAKTVIGGSNPDAGHYLMSLLYETVIGEKIVTDIRTSETVKYVDNVFHALKITFANEVGTLCRSLGVDSHKVMDIFCKDRKLNLSANYLKPGKPFGGSCLPKDLKALTYRAKMLDVELPVIGGILRSNEHHSRNIAKLIISFNKKTIGVIGISFKEGTDDLRYSPTVEIIETLIGKGYRVGIFDRNVSLSKIYGSNKKYLLERIPHISSLLTTDLNGLIESSEVVVIANKSSDVDILSAIGSDKIIVDLVRVDGLLQRENYYGVCW